MITIYHNTRCKKSRDGFDFLEEKGIDFEVRQYLKDPLTAEELKALISKTGLTPFDIIRKEEAYFKQNLKGKDLSDNEWIEEMLKEPKLIQRPIVENGNKAVLARPAEEIEKIL